MTIPVVLGSATLNLAQDFPSSNYIETTIDLGSSDDRWIICVVMNPGGSQDASSIGTTVIDPAGVNFALTEDSDEDATGLFGPSRVATFRSSGGSMPSGSKVVRVNLADTLWRSTAYLMWGHTGTIPNTVTIAGNVSTTPDTGAITSTTNDRAVGVGWAASDAGNLLSTGSGGTTVLDGDMSGGYLTYTGFYGMHKAADSPNTSLTATLSGHSATPSWGVYGWIVAGTGGAGQSQAPRSMHQFKLRRS